MTIAADRTETSDAPEDSENGCWRRWPCAAAGPAAGVVNLKFNFIN